MQKILLVLISFAFLMTACGKSEKTEKIEVASQMGDCVGVAPMKCLLIKKEGNASWEFFYGNIEGFNYEPGYEYILEIKEEKVENPAADQSALKYILVKEILKEKKESENLPQLIIEEVEEEVVLLDSIK